MPPKARAPLTKGLVKSSVKSPASSPQPISPRRDTHAPHIYTLPDSSVYFANALRRVLLSEVVCPGVPNAYASAHAGGRPRVVRVGAAADVTQTDGTTKEAVGCGVVIRQNTGRLHNEFLRHRLSMLPLSLDPRRWTALRPKRLVLRLRKACPNDSDAPVVVTSEDFTLVLCGDDDTRSETGGAGPTEELTEEFAKQTGSDASAPVATSTPALSPDGSLVDVTPYLLPHTSQLVPTDPVVDRVLRAAGLAASVPRGIVITRLYAGEALDVDLHPGVGTSRSWAGYAPMHTVTYVPRPLAAPTHFDFRLQTLGTYRCDDLVRRGWDTLARKVRTFETLLQPNTVEVDFGGVAHPSLHTDLSSTERRCWVMWSNVDFLTRLQAPEEFYRRHCHEVIAAAGPRDPPLSLTPFSKTTRVPAVDGEDLIESTERTKHVLALNQPIFGDNGVYEYVASERAYKHTPQAHATYLIAREGREQRAMVFTSAEIVDAHDTRCVLRFGDDVDPHVMEYLQAHIHAIVCADAAGRSVRLNAPTAVRPPITVTDQCADDPARKERVFQIVVPEEDHTLGNMVQGFVFDQHLRDGERASTATKAGRHGHGLLAIGYKQPLPSARTIHFRVEFDRPLQAASTPIPRVSPVVPVLSAWLRALAAEVDRLGAAATNVVAEEAAR